MGFSRIQHCCGSSEILLALSEMDLLCSEKSCEAGYEGHHQCQHSSCGEAIPCAHDHQTACPDQQEHSGHTCTDFCQDHTAPGFHRHHHDNGCLNADFLQLRPQQKQDNSFTQLLALVPVEIKVFDFEPQPQIIPLCDKSDFIVPKEAGRQKLALFSIFLI